MLASYLGASRSTNRSALYSGRGRAGDCRHPRWTTLKGWLPYLWRVDHQRRPQADRLMYCLLAGVMLLRAFPTNHDAVATGAGVSLRGLSAADHYDKSSRPTARS